MVLMAAIDQVTETQKYNEAKALSHGCYQTPVLHTRMVFDLRS